MNDGKNGKPIDFLAKIWCFGHFLVCARKMGENGQPIALLFGQKMVFLRYGKPIALLFGQKMVFLGAI